MKAVLAAPEGSLLVTMWFAQGCPASAGPSLAQSYLKGLDCVTY